MAQDSTYNLPNIDRGAASRAKLNSIFEAVKTQNSGGSEPASPSAFMLWADSATDYLKIRNEANTNWNIIGKLNSEGLVLTSAGNPNGAVTGLYEGQLLFDTTNNIPWYYSGSSTSWFTTNNIPTTSFSGATYTALITDNIIRYTGATTATLTLPTAVGNTNKEYLIINSSTTQLTYLTIDANASETINGSLTFAMQGANNEYVKIKSDGTNWYVIDQPPNSRTISDQTVSNVASVTFNNIGTYRDYELTIDAGPSTNGAALCLRTSTDNGSTYTATAGAYISQVFVATGGAYASATYTATLAHLTDTLVGSAIHGGVVRIVGALTSWEYTTMLSNFKVVTNPPAHSLAIVNSRREVNEITNAFQVLATSGNITGRFILRGFN